jgi:uncharacterized membrane protein YgdD (TMEM256/DUF423 family)
MKPEARQIAAMAAGLLALGVAAAAVGSHVLAGNLDATAMRRFQTATQVLMWQGLGLLALMRWASLPEREGLVWIGLMMLSGTALFCGSVYALAFGAPRGVASAAPIGGLMMIGSWLGAAGLIWRLRT